MQLIETKSAPEPRGHYSQAVVAQGLVFVSGILPILPGTNRQIPEGLQAQVEQVFENLQAILQAADSDLHHVISVQIFISDMTLWEAVNEIYARILQDHKPARSVIPCGTLNGGALLELTAIARQRSIPG